MTFHPASGRTLDWRQNQDLRSFDHMFDMQIPDNETKLWTPGHCLDQGNVGGCTGFGSAGAFATMPRKKIATDTNHYGMALYELATSRDPYPGDWPTQDTGSSVNAAMRAARDLKLIASYKWLSSADAIQNALLTTGPVVFGSPFYNSMFDLDEQGRMIVDKSSGLAGGHCWFMFGAAIPGTNNRNSWGTSWGREGDFNLLWTDVQKLVDDGAEAAVPIGYAA